MKKHYNQNITFLFCLFISLLSASLAFGQNNNQITKISTSDISNQTQLTFELKSLTDYKPEYRIFTIANPERLVIDFTDSTLAANVDKISHPLFSSIRNSLNNQDQLRIVFDLKNSVKILKSTISKSNQNKYYLKINLSNPETTNLDVKTKPASPYKLSKPTTDPIAKLIDEQTGTVKYVIKKVKPFPVIIIDAGHGGKDPGTIGKFARSKEKHITLGYAKELKKQLDLTGRFRVFVTRDKDYFIPLNGRIDKARKAKADLFISLHADSSPDSSTSGLSIYTLSEKSSDKQAELLAQKENKSDIIGGADFSDASGDILKTLINLSQRNTMNESAKFAEIVIKSIRENNVETLQKTHRFAGFRVLTAPDVPSVLIELGYLSNKDEEKKLNSLQHKKEVAESLVDAIEKYFGN